MSSITISRQMGSLGFHVARLAAAALGFRVVWREVINQAAIRAGVPEVALATIDELGLLGMHPSFQARQAYLDAVRQLMEELAAQGRVVIVGRAGQAILQGRPDVLHVRIVAPSGLRAERIAQCKQISLDAAQAQVEASDRARQKYLRQNYAVRWDDPALYDLVINTERLSPEAGAALICSALEMRQPKPTDKTTECE